MKPKVILALAATVVAVVGCSTPWGATLTPAQRRFLAAPRAERMRIMADAEARAKLVEGTVQEFDGVFNFRDLGGKRGLGGRWVRPRRLYRSARFDQVTDEGRRELTEGLRIRTDLDLRSNGEVSHLNGRSPLGTNVMWKLVPLQSYADIVTPHGRKGMRAALQEVFCPTNWPLAFHCKTGKDRTGTLAFVVLALLGVDEETICLDWERTAFHVPELSRMSHPSRYDRLLASFMSLPGTNLTAKAEGYVRSLGFSAAEINGFRERLLAPPLRIRRLSVDVGADRPFSVLHVSDSHLNGVDSRDGEDVRAFARSRANRGRELGEPYLDEALAYARAHRLPVVHTGDVIETASQANFSRAGELLRSNGVLACVGNHEFWRTSKTSDEEAKDEVSDSVSAAYPGEQPVYVFETNGVSFIVFDNAFGRVSPAVAAAFERVVAKGRPIVMVCHVPFPAEELLNSPDDRDHLTGEGVAKNDATTAAFVARVRAEPLVRAILCGHLHDFARVRFSPTAEMCVANALFNGEAIEVAFGP